MVVRPAILFEGFPVQNPVDEFSSYGFLSGMWVLAFSIAGSH